MANGLSSDLLPVTPGKAHWDPQGENPNRAVPDANNYYPLTEPAIGSVLPAKDFPQNNKIPKLFQEIKIRDVVFKNRIWVAPMCQYSSAFGHTSDWHLVHIGSMATRGAGSICMEASAVVPEGRITPEDNGIWSDSHIPGLKRIVEFAHAHGTKIGIQLAHAGRKASTRAPWVTHDLTGARLPNSESDVATKEEGGWEEDVVAPSAIPWSKSYPKPKEMTLEQIAALEEAFAAAVRRCVTIGFDYVELHGAHGYLIHSFVSPLSNKRTDQYGGSLENRLRLPLQLARRIRKEWPEDKPFFYRISASDHAEGPEKSDSGEWLQWGIEQSTELAKQLSEIGVDVVDVSSGGNWEKQKIELKPGYQVPFAQHIKKALPNLLVSTVGLITDAHQAESILSAEDQSSAPDIISMAREFLRDVDFPLRAAQELRVAVAPTHQYERAWTRMFKPTSVEGEENAKSK